MKKPNYFFAKVVFSIVVMIPVIGYLFALLMKVSSLSRNVFYISYHFYAFLLMFIYLVHL